MLIHISIRQLATIEHLELNFSSGTHLITGETGAGKSILMEAIEIALGARANPSWIRQGAASADMTLIFDFKHQPAILDWLREHDLANSDDELCYIRRHLTQEGRSRSWINGIPSPLEKIKILGKQCIYFQGQFAEQALFNHDEQQDMLDRFSQTLSLSKQLGTLAIEWKTLKNKQKQWEKEQTLRAQTLEFLQFQLNELEPLELHPTTWDTLESTHRKQLQQDKYQQILQNAQQLIQGDVDKNILSQLQQLRRLIDELSSMETKSKAWLKSIEESCILLNELNDELHHDAQEEHFSQEEAEKIEEKMSTHYQLARKYKINPEHLYQHYQHLKEEFSRLENHDTQLSDIQSQLNAVFSNYQKIAAELSEQRLLGAKKLETLVNQQIKTLGLPNAKFKIHFSKAIIDAASATLPVDGLENIEFLFKANPDQTLQPLQKIISGGELSRLSLCLHLALADKAAAPTFIFDEVDTGMSGKISQEIGRLLKELGKNKQVFCITHQASVAVFADHHLCVNKRIIEDRTHTEIKYLSSEEKILEIARLLSGNIDSKKTLAHAREILENVKEIN